LVKYGLGNEANGDHHVFWTFEIIVQVEIFDVHSHEEGIGGGDDTIKDEFGSGEACRFGTDVARIINEVTPRGPTDTACLGFLRAIGDDVTKIGGTAAFGDGGMTDEADCVGTLGLFIAVGKATGLLGTRFFPEGTVILRRSSGNSTSCPVSGWTALKAVPEI
jgi:hypothetical protein